MQKIALREAGDSQNHTFFPESQEWQSVNDLAELRKLDMEANRPSPDTIAANALGSAIPIAERPRLSGNREKPAGEIRRTRGLSNVAVGWPPRSEAVAPRQHQAVEEILEAVEEILATEAGT